MTTSGKLPTTLCSFCRSLNRPSPLAARCSRVTAIQRLPPSWPPYCLGREKRQKPAASARRTHSDRRASQSGCGRPPLAQSVRACSRRWSKKRSLSCECWRGLMEESIKVSREWRYWTRSGGRSKFMSRLRGTGRALPGRVG